MKNKILAIYNPLLISGSPQIFYYINFLSSIVNKGSFHWVDPVDPAYVVACRTIEYAGYGHEQFIFKRDAPMPEFNNMNFYDLIEVAKRAIFRIAPDYWIYNLKSSLESFINNCSTTGIIVYDLTRPDEYALLKSMGAKFARITDPGQEIIKSETEGLLEDYEFDYQLIDNKSMRKTYCAQLSDIEEYFYGQRDEL